MYKHLLCMNTSPDFGCSVEEQIKLLHDTGFDGFFTHWGKELPIEKWAALAKDTGMLYQSIHAPFDGTAQLWRCDKDAADFAEKQLLQCVHSCSDNGIDLMVSHCYIGFDGIVEITESGLERYGRIIDEAEKCGVRIAFENTEGLEYLDSLMTVFKDRKNVGFCLDTGHENCYNFGENLLARWGDRLIATHLNDNLGIKDYNGKITWHDDLHLLPFDGIRDWDELAKRFSACGYDGVLTFELCKQSKPGRHENDIYDRMSLQDYFAACYIRACRFAAKLK